MYEDDIEKMNLVQLRNEVQTLRDELAKFKRKYEDAINNLDGNNFGRSFTAEQNNMKAQLRISAEAIKTMVSNDTFESIISQTAERISSVVSEAIDVSKAVEVDSPDDFEDINKIYVIRKEDDSGEVVSETFYYYNAISHKWEIVKDSDAISSIFLQTSDGFKLKGNVKVDGSCILTDSLTFDSEDKPVKVQYSVDGTDDTWHYDFVPAEDKFMRMQIGATWTDAIKIVGDDGLPGEPGAPGRDANYEQISSILATNYKIKETVIDGNSVVTATLHSAQLYTPNIYGENLTLVTQNASNKEIYNNLYLTPTSMYLVNAYGSDTAKTKFYVDLGSDTSNSIVRMRLGAGVDAAGAQALNFEKYEDEIRIGTYVDSTDEGLTDFAGMIITPSTGAITFTGTVQAVAVFG